MKSHYQLSPHLTSFIVWTIKHKNTETFFKPYCHSVIAIYWPDSFQLDIIEAAPDMLDHIASVITWLAIITQWTCRYQVNHFTVFFDTHNGVSVIFTSFILIQWWYYMYIPTQINHYMPGPFLAMWSACVKSRGGGCSI